MRGPGRKSKQSAFWMRPLPCTVLATTVLLGLYLVSRALRPAGDTFRPLTPLLPTKWSKQALASAKKPEYPRPQAWPWQRVVRTQVKNEFPLR